MSSEILFIAHRLPFPPDRGDKIRSHHVLRQLARKAPVHVATFADDERDMAEEVELAAIARSYCLLRRAKPLVLAGIEALLRREPVSVAAFRDAELAAYVEEVLATRPIGTIYVFSGQMGQYVPAGFRGRVIMDFVDVDSANFEAYAGRGRRVRRIIDAREARLLSIEEARLANRADTSLLISDEETELFRDRLPPDLRHSCDVRTLRNGVDTHFYDPAVVLPEPALAQMAGPKLIFTGQMDYAPNVEAAMRVIERILPRIRSMVPAATFHVVGRRPVPQLVAKHGREGIHVWGAVEDVRPWLAAADLALVPLEIARGVQNKVLEAMAMALPVVLSPAAAAGIGASTGQYFAIAGSDQAFADRVAALLSHPRQARAMGLQARRHLLEHMSWQAMLAPLTAMLGQERASHRHAA